MQDGVGTLLQSGPVKSPIQVQEQSGLQMPCPLQKLRFEQSQVTPVPQVPVVCVPSFMQMPLQQSASWVQLAPSPSLHDASVHTALVQPVPHVPAGQVHRPLALQIWPVAQVPQEPPQPSPPQSLPAHFGPQQLPSEQTSPDSAPQGVPFGAVVQRWLFGSQGVHSWQGSPQSNIPPQPSGTIPHKSPGAQREAKSPGTQQLPSTHSCPAAQQVPRQQSWLVPQVVPSVAGVWMQP